MKIEVAKNAKRNIVIGIINKIILLILPFVVRAIINTSLGAEYLGLNSLFSAIIQVLSLTELGFSSAVIYHMYKPIAENNYDRINAILKLYRSVYRIIGLAIILIGTSLTPFLPKLISGTYPDGINIYILFFIYIINSSISYLLFGYKQSLLVAYQRDDLNSIINLVVQLGMQFSQIVILLITHNYYYYAICMPFFTIVNNLWIGFVTKKMFPWAKPFGNLDGNIIKDIKRLVTGTFISKACDISRNSLDSIFVSTFLGLTLTGIYNNYYAVFNGISNALMIIVTSLSGGIGNHVAIKTVEENFDELQKMDFLYMSISGVCTTCLLCMYQSFMKIWMGNNMLLPFGAVVLLCIYFYLLKMGDMRYLYSAANGLWWKLKWKSIVETAANIILNIVLGRLFGVYGIILATIITIFFFGFLWSAVILFDEYFMRDRLIKYIAYHFKYAIVTALVCATTYIITNLIIEWDGTVIEFVIKGMLTLIISIVMFFLVYYKTSIFKRSIRVILRKNDF